MPYKSRAQAAYFNIHKRALEAQGVNVGEWNSASKGKSLPYHVAKKADGGALDDQPDDPGRAEWDQLPHSPEGRPRITVTKQPYDLLREKAQNLFSSPEPLSPLPDRKIGQNPYAADPNPLATEQAKSWKDMLDPFAKDESGKYIADQPMTPNAHGKVPEATKDPVSFIAPLAAEAASMAPTPGGLGKAAMFGLGMAKKAAKPIAKAIEEGFLDTSKFISTSASKGTMAGGFKKNPLTGEEWYVKSAPGLEQAKNEKLTSEIYKLLGVPTADVQLTQIGGKPGIASKKIEGATQLGDTATPYHHIEDLHENYPIHAWLANHDAVGTGPENPLGNIMVKDNKAHVIDTGGGLLYKGTGTPKAKFTPEVNELETMRDPEYSHLSASVFGGIRPEVARVGAQKIANIDDVALANLVEKYGPSDPWKKVNLLSTLLKRKQDIQAKFGVKPGDPIPQMKPKDQFKQEPWVDPDHNKPLTDEDWDKILGSPPPPEDFQPLYKSAKDYGSEAKPDGYQKSLGNLWTSTIENGQKFPTDAIKNVAKKTLNGIDENPAWNSALNLWDIAENANPQVAEALFRNLPAKTQIDVGHRLAALKEELGYSPFNAVAKDSGKDGKFPSEYNYFKTDTNSFKPPSDVLKSPEFQESLKKYAQHFEQAKLTPAEVAAKETEPSIPETKVLGHQLLGWASPNINAFKDANKILDAYHLGDLDGHFASDFDLKGIGHELAAINKEYPGYGNKILSAMPSHLHFHINKEVTEAAGNISKVSKVADEKKIASGAFSEEEGRGKALFQKDSPVGIAFAQKYLEPIKDWKSWKPPINNYTKPEFGNELKTHKVKSLGFNTEFEIHKGGSHWEGDEIPHPIDKPTEKAWFGSDQSWVAQQYGSTSNTYVARGKAFEVDWKSYTGSSHGEWSPIPMHNLIEAARKDGADIIAIHGMSDMGGSNQTQYAVLNPAVLRSPKAKFDPKNLDKSWPLAGLVGGGLFTYGQLKGDDKMNRGGRPKKMAFGGSNSFSVGPKHPHPRHPAGMIKSSIPGRTDKIPMSVPPGSYILPADIPSALGQGNTMAGEKILGNMFKIGPYGSGETGKISGGHPARIQANWMKTPRLIGKIHMADGGEANGSGDIPIIAAGGEYVIHPEQVKDIGHGDMDAGHRVLDKFVLGIRKRHIETLKGLKGPKKG